MPMSRGSIQRLNAAFLEDRVDHLVQESQNFAPGKSLPTALASIMEKPGTALYRGIRSYLAKMPVNIQETLRDNIYRCLKTQPPMLITFAWVAAYEFELTLWNPPCGLTVLLKGPYENDKSRASSRKATT
jgi:hypothetical protein